MSILKAVPESVLFLYASHEATETNLRAQASRQGVDPQRLVFGERMDRCPSIWRGIARPTCS